MMVLDEIEQCRGRRPRARHKVNLPQTRPSILNPCLETEPWIDHCCCSDKLFLFLHNHPIAMIPGSSLDCFALNMRLNQLRHRLPRK
jgi:hypothetical protein